MRILLADDQHMVRDGLQSFLSVEAGFDVDTAADLPSVFDILKSSPRYDVILLDYQMPGMDGLVGAREVMDAVPDTPVAVISGTSSPDVPAKAIAMGAAGFLPKSLPARSLINALKFIAAGERYVPVERLTQMADTQHEVLRSLTSREKEVLVGLCQGKTNKEIARDLGLSEPTIKVRVQKLSRKLGAKNRTQAVLNAKELGFDPKIEA